ncbi:spore coat protein [Dehalobacterium formicoaceticum]|uniref:Spore coat protein n=1 Tax=Dehalobacterium formicoaceticum TaxID=51515 RepID=A0ABT1Y5U7_9FIRM|nr:spore coat protein [Dehalobacterium formicoaceticum]MCR6546255.1 spore coat protein [Dehalobacterium formicoaceticum]
MTISLTSKERSLLEDQKSHEELCIQKYTGYAMQASDPQLQNLFQNHAKIEQEHLNTINQLLSGQIPAMNQQQNQGQGQQQSQQQTQQSTNSFQAYGTPAFQPTDMEMCNDLLMTEKYVSGTYDTTIFESRDTQMRQVLNHIQKEEQEHGDAIFKYMESKGMYTPQ